MNPFNPMNKYSRYIKSKKSMNETKNLIRKLKTQAPVLSTILNYGGTQSVKQIIALDDEDKKAVQNNPFAKIVNQKSSFDDNQTAKKRHPSFINYMSSPRNQKILDLSPRASKKKSLKTSIVVEMPKELKVLKNQVLSLPSIARRQNHQLNEQNQIRLTHLQSSGSIRSSNLRISSKYRFKTEESKKLKGNSFNKQHYVRELKNIIEKFEQTDEGRQNIRANHMQIHRLSKKEKEIGQRFKRIQSYGNPPQKIINLLEDVQEFENNIDNGLDEDLKIEIKNMSSKKFDTILKYEVDKKKIDSKNYRQQIRKQKIEDSKNTMIQQAAYKEDTKRFKLNSKGHEVYTYNKK